MHIIDEMGQPVDFISFDPVVGAIELHPDEFSPIGLRPYSYVVVMTGYPERFTTQPFEANVLDCAIQEIFSNGGFVESKASTWGDDAVTVLATDAINGFSQFPSCGYDLVFTPKLVNLDGSTSPLPANEVTFQNS